MLEKARKHLAVLSVDIGPRGPTSVGEKKAGAYIEQTLKSAGIHVTSENFLSPNSSYWIVIFYVFIFSITVFIFLLNAIVAFILAFVIVAIFLREMNLKHIVSRIMPKRESRNIIGEISPKSFPKRRVILTGHYDTAKPLPFFHPKIVKYFDIIVLIAGISMLLVNTFLGLGALFQNLPQLRNMSNCFWFASLPFIAYLCLVGLCLAYGELLTKPTNGANDNASGISVVLSIAEFLAKNPLEHTEVWCVATGCEESGTVGMIHFLDKNKECLKDSFILNFDCVGIGNLKYIVKEGLLKTISVPQEIVKIVETASEKNPELEIGPLSLKYKTSDSYPALSRGLKSICIMAVDQSNLPSNWHWKTDVFDNIQDSVLENAQRFMLEILKIIDSSD